MGPSEPAEVYVPAFKVGRKVQKNEVYHRMHVGCD